MNTKDEIETAIPLPPPMRTSATRTRGSLGQSRRRRGGILAAGVLASVGVFAVAVLAHSSEPKTAKPTPERLLNGELPETLADLNAWYPQPAAGANAADYYLKAAEGLKVSGGNTSVLPFFGQGRLPALDAPLDEQMRTALRNLAADNRQPLLWLAEGAKYGQCRYPLDFTQGIDLVYRSFQDLEKCSLLLESDALFQADSRHGSQAANDVRVNLCLADSLADAPATLPQLMRGRMISYSVRALQQLLNRTTLPPAAATELLKTLQRLEKRDAEGEVFSRMMIGERVMGLAALAHPEQLLRGLAAPDLKMSAERRAKIKERIRSGGALNRERAFFDEAFQQLIAARKSPFPQRLDCDALSQKLAEQADAQGFFVLDLILPSMGRRTGLEAKCLTNLRLAIAAVALEQFRAAHRDQYPASLTELVPYYLSASPLDPFSGEALQYQKEGAGYTLSSVGDGSLSFAVVHPPAR